MFDMKAARSIVYVFNKNKLTVVLGGNCPDGSCPGGCCPDTVSLICKGGVRKNVKNH